MCCSGGSAFERGGWSGLVRQFQRWHSRYLVAELLEVGDRADVKGIGTINVGGANTLVVGSVARWRAFSWGENEPRCEE